MSTILIVEDEATLRHALQRGLSQDQHSVIEAGCVRDAWELTREHDFDAVVTDVNLPGESGIELVRRLREDGFEGAVVVMTGVGSVEIAVGAMKAGADDYLAKPVSIDDLSLRIGRAIEQRRAGGRLRLYERIQGVRSSEALVVGESQAWTRALTLAKKFASMPIPDKAGAELPAILLLGETGVGKGVIAEYVHRADPASSGASPRPFVHVNCAALPASLIESELFGHEKGAFTDAKSARAGLFELAEGGTIFLDEIGELPLEMQAKLLTVVEKGLFRRIGGQKERTARVRIIAATNQDLEQRVREGRFRRDLLYRLNALTVRMPPLRERDGDSVLIARAMLQRLSGQQGRGTLRLDPGAEKLIQGHDWPGNVRELINAVKRASILCEAPVVMPEDLGLSAGVNEGAQVFHGQTAQGLPLETSDGIPLINGRLPSVDQMEKMLIDKALKAARGNVSLAAKLIGLNRGALRYRIERLGMETNVEQAST